MSRPRTLAALTIFTALSGCKDSTPARIGLTYVPDSILSREPVFFSPQVENAAGDVLEGVTVSVTAIHPDIVAVSPSRLTCLKSGDTSVTVNSANLMVSVPIRCRLVAFLSAPPSVQLLVGMDAGTVPVIAMNEADEPLLDVEVKLLIEDPNVAVVEGNRLVAVGVGRTSLKAKAGDAQADVEVLVAQKLLVDNLVLDDGVSQTRTFDAGNYQVEVQVASADTVYGVTTRWVGESCPAEEESQHIITSCRVTSTASLVIENPTAFGMGPPATGNITILKIP